MDIMTGLHAVSETLKITKELRNIDNEMDKAELKLRLSDLVDGLLEAKEALQDAKQREYDLRKQISSLKEELDGKSKYEDEKGRLYLLDEGLNRIGEPSCHHCFVKEEKLFRMIFQPQGEYDRASYWCENHRGAVYL